MDYPALMIGHSEPTQSIFRAGGTVLGTLIVHLNGLLQCPPSEHGALHALRKMLHTLKQLKLAERILIFERPFTGDDGAEIL